MREGGFKGNTRSYIYIYINTYISEEGIGCMLHVFSVFSAWSPLMQQQHTYTYTVRLVATPCSTD